MKFDKLLARWMEAEMAVATYRLTHPGRGRPEVNFLCAQLKDVANDWYGQVLAEVRLARRRLPLI